MIITNRIINPKRLDSWLLRRQEHAGQSLVVILVDREDVGGVGISSADIVHDGFALECAG